MEIKWVYIESHRIKSMDNMKTVVLTQLRDSTH